MRIGQGYDVHKLVEGRDCIICGVKIPYEKGLLGHSDADVALHALADAILGAAALGDIGKHFPDTDEKYKGADSRMLFGSTSRNRPSRFSLEIPLDLINKTREQDWRKPDLGTKMPVAETELRRKSATAAMHFGQVTPPARSGNVFKTGDMVQHKTFGKGLVISATPMGNDVLLEIAFEQGTKKLMANFARLAKVE